MSNKINPETDADHAAVYHISVKGHLDPQWASWFDEMTITLDEDGETLLSGMVADQSALHGLLRKVRDLGMPLISVKRIDPGQTNESIIKP
jgi:hypothetical protein